MSRPTPLVFALSIALVAVAFLPVAAAQSGPAPGYDDPLVYAQDYTAAKADNASTDPTGFASAHASQQAVVDEAAHTAYIACWTADAYAEANPEICADFYTAAGSADAIQEADPSEAEEAAEDVVDATEELASELDDAVETILDDPTAAPTVIESVIAAVAAFVEDIGTGIVGAVIALAQGVVATVQDIVDGGLAGNAAGSQAVGEILTGLDEATGSAMATVDTLGDKISEATATLAGGLDMATSSASGMAGAIGDAIAATTGDAGSALLDGSTSAADGIQAAAGSVADFTSDVVSSIRDTVTGWFAGSDNRSNDRAAPTDRVTDTADSLVDDVLGLLG